MEQNIGLSIRKARELRGFTRKQLAKKLNTSTDVLSKLENEAKNPSMDYLNKISRALQIPIGYILILGVTEKSIPKKYRYKYNIARESIFEIVSEIFKK